MSTVARDTTTSKYRLGVLVALLAGEIFPRHSRGAHLVEKCLLPRKKTLKSNPKCRMEAYKRCITWKASHDSREQKTHLSYKKLINPKKNSFERGGGIQIWTKNKGQGS